MLIRTGATGASADKLRVIEWRVEAQACTCRELMDHLRSHSPAHLAAGSMSTPAAVQTASALEVIMGRDGSTRGAAKLAQLRDNANYMRRRLTELGCLVLGDYDSPVLVRPPVARAPPRDSAPLLRPLLPLSCRAKLLTGLRLRSVAVAVQRRSGAGQGYASVSVTFAHPPLACLQP